MGGLNGIGVIVWQRLLASWRLLSVLAFGILIAATLLAASPVYTRVMNDLGLQSSLQEILRSSSRNGAATFQPFGSPEAAAKAKDITAVLSEELGWLSEAEVRYGHLPRLSFGKVGQPLDTEPTHPWVELHGMSDFEEHAEVVAGRLPQATNDPKRIEVALPIEAAILANVQPGDQLIAAQAFDDCNRPAGGASMAEQEERARFACQPQAFLTMTATFTVTGFIKQKDPEERYWGAGSFVFGRPQPPEEEGPTFLFIMPEETYFQALAQVLPGIPAEFRVTHFADLRRLNSANISRVRADIAGLRERLESQGDVANSGMEGPLRDFQGRADFNQIPLLLLLIQVVGIAIYYVLLVSTLLVERRAEEIAMLRSRGASVGQVVVLSAAEAAVLIVGVVIVAPFLASGIVALLGKTGTFSSISGGHFLAYTIVPESFLFALIGAVLAGIAVIIPAFFAARKGMVGFLHAAARPGQSFVQRYYIDLGLVGIAAFGLWELNHRGSVFDAESIGGWSADPLVLLSPFILILAVGSLMFRFLPIVLGLISRIASATVGAGFTLGLWQLTRSPSRYTQLALLVVMAAAVGTFAATYGETTDRSQRERALYQAGADVRLTGLGSLDNLSTAEIKKSFESIEGVEAVATANRTSLPLGPLSGLGPAINVLAIDAEEASKTVWFRDDFAGEDFDTLMRRLIGFQAVDRGLVLPGEPRRLSVWVNPSEARPATTMWARIIDAGGRFHFYELGSLGFEGGYQRLSAVLPVEQDLLEMPISLVSLVMTQGPGGPESAQATVRVDDITVTDSNGQDTVVESFEGPFRWDALATATRNRDSLSQVGQGTHSGPGAAQFSFRTGISQSIRGLYVKDPNLPIPVIASPGFLAATGLAPGGQAEVVMGSLILPVSIQGVVGLFPTLGEGPAGYLIINQATLAYFQGLTGQGPISPRPNEIWLTVTQDRQTRAQVLETIRDRFNIVRTQTVNSEDLLRELGADPIVRAGGSGILLIALIAAFSILALGFALTLYLGGEARTVEVSVMRAVGISPGQLLAMISLEYLLVAGVGLVIGTIAGLRISETMLSFLNVTEDGSRVIPPFSLTTSWDTVAIAFAATAAAFLVGIVALAVYFLRLQVSRILRLTR